MPEQVTEDSYKIDSPTLMVGLGGLGSYIVRNVYAKLPEDHKQKAIAHIMDTDVSELKATDYAELMNQHRVTQTSNQQTVGTTFDQLKQHTAVEQWFPPIKQLYHKKMSKGAAQVRAVSRLAILDTIKSGRINRLNNNIDELLRLDHSDILDAVRVVIVSSLAGGTGSGSFLQMALYIREYLKRQHQFENATFRGFLVMPEIFIKNGDYAGGQDSGGAEMEATVRANGYACFKELDAVIRQRNGLFEDRINSKTAPLFPLQLEYYPEQTDRQAIADGTPPFDVVTLFNYSGKNHAGATTNLGGKNQYIRQVEDAVRLHLFSPLEGRGGVEAREDNLATKLLATEGRARYAGCGSSAIEYPVNDLSRYIALRWIDDGISAQWRELDEIIIDQIRTVMEDRKQGIYEAIPDERELFCTLLKDKAEAENPQPFYKVIFDQAHNLDEQGRRVDSKHQSWLNTVKKRLESAAEHAIRETIGSADGFSVESFSDADTVISQVGQSERLLTDFAYDLEQRVQHIGRPIANDIVWRAYQSNVPFEQNAESQLNTWILGKDQAIHPLTVRYFLAEAKAMLDRKIITLEKQLKSTQDKIKRYDYQWDHPDTDLTEKTPQDHARAVIDQYFATWRGLVKDFAESYNNKRNAHLRNLKDQAKQTIFLDAYKTLSATLENFLQYWEGWFNALKYLSDGVVKELNLLTNKHDVNDQADRTKIYVRASSEIKQKLWAEYQAELKAEEVPTDISRELYLNFYRQQGAAHKEREPFTMDAKKLIQEFRANILGWCEQMVRKNPNFNMNVADAIKSERKLLGSNKTDEQYFQQCLNKLENLAVPWVLSGQLEPQFFAYTCLNPDVAEKWGDAIVEQYVDSPMINSGFSPYKITRMSLLYGLSATDLNSLGSNSVYEQNYRNHLAKSRQHQPEAYTPHLDRHWDSPAFLPELSDEQQQKGLNDIYRAVLFTLAEQAAGNEGIIFKQQYDRQEVWHESPERDTILPLLGADGKLIESNTYGMLYGFACHYDLVEQAIKMMGKDEKRHSKNTAELIILQQMSAIVDKLEDLPNQAPSKQEGELFRKTLLSALVSEIEDIFYRIYNNRPNTATQEAKPHLQTLVEKSQQLIDNGKTWGDILQRQANQAIKHPKHRQD